MAQQEAQCECRSVTDLGDQSRAASHLGHNLILNVGPNIHLFPVFIVCPFPDAQAYKTRQK